MSHIRFTTRPTGAGRRHYLTASDILVLLDRLPAELWTRLRHVHFNDKAWGNRRLGYVTRGRREIAICALPTHVSLGRMFRKHRFPASHFGAPARGQWPTLAIRRFLLYDVFLHELGHLQIVNSSTRSSRLRFAREKLAQAFADRWRCELWTRRFEHLDPAHGPPRQEELIGQEFATTQ